MNLERLDQRPIALEGVGVSIFELVDGFRSTDEIIEVMTRSYGEVDGLAEDVSAFLDDLAATGLIVPVP